MSFVVKIKDKAIKKLGKFPKNIRKRIELLILILKENPLPYLKFDLKKMEGYENIYRVRMGDIRIIYQINFKNKVIIILDADYRGRIY